MKNINWFGGRGTGDEVIIYNRSETELGEANSVFDIFNVILDFYYLLFDIFYLLFFPRTPSLVPRTNN